MQLNETKERKLGNIKKTYGFKQEREMKFSAQKLMQKAVRGSVILAPCRVISDFESHNKQSKIRSNSALK